MGHFHNLSFSPLLSGPRVAPAPPEVLDQLAALLEDRTLMQFGGGRRAHLINTLMARSQATGLSDLTSYIQQVTAPGGEAELMVLVDELALPFGKIRIGPRGSDGGHNGLKSIQEEIGTMDYPRLRFGIGSEFRKGAQVN